MRQTASQKILARAGGRARIAAGEHLVVKPDLMMTYDPQGGALHHRFAGRWGKEARLFDPERLVLVADHFLDLSQPAHRARQDGLDAFAKAYGVRHYYPVGAPNYGVCHALLPEEGLIRPGELIAGTDSHSSTYGGFGAIGLNVGLDAMEGLLAIGRHWLEMPPEIRIEVTGALPPGVGAKDVALKLCADLTDTALAFGAAIELDGEAIQALHPEEKLTIANMAQEIGARWLIIPADDAVSEWVARLGAGGFEPVRPDPGAAYAQVLRYRGEAFQRLVARPGGPKRAVPVAQERDQDFNEVFVGSCTGAKQIDLERVFATLQAEGGLAPGVALMLAPATRRGRDWILADPARSRLLDEQAISLAEHPGCNACAGLHGFIAGESAVRLSTGNRNYAGRMGAAGACVFLGSAETAALVATTGRLGA